MKYSDWNEDEDEEADEIDDWQGDDTTEPCPNCGEEVYDDAERCPHCGHYISDEDERRSAKPWWVILGALLCLAVAVLWLLG